MSDKAYVGLGSNEGDRLENLKNAVGELKGVDGIEVTQASTIYDTDPVGPPQANFLNAVVEIECDLGPQALLSSLKAIEASMGRTEGGEWWGPRVIDLDLLLYGDERIDSPELQLPHPEMARRAFVLVPLAEIAPDVVLDGTTIAELRANIDEHGVRGVEGRLT